MKATIIGGGGLVGSSTAFAMQFAGIVREIPPIEVRGAPDGDLLLLGWGSTYGSLEAAPRALTAQGKRVGAAKAPPTGSRRNRVASTRHCVMPIADLPSTSRSAAW